MEGDRTDGWGCAVTVDVTGLLEDELLDVLTGLGPLQPYLDDPTVEEIWVNEPGRVFVARGGRSELTATVLAAGEVERPRRADARRGRAAGWTAAPRSSTRSCRTAAGCTS